MKLNIEGFDGQTYVVDVGVDDTAKDLRRKVATTAGFAEDSFHMHTQGFGGNDEGEDFDITALSADDTVMLTQTKKYESIAALSLLGETDLTPERLASVQNPEVAQLFLHAEVVTAIPSSFLESTNLCSLDLSAPLAITAIGNRFLLGCTSLTSINFAGLGSVTSLGDFFLFGCTALTSINFTGLKSVTSLGGSFLADCTALTSINFAGLGNVTSLRDDFLADCTALTSINFAGLSNVTSLGDFFLADCTELTSIEFAGLGNVTSLGESFLLCCTALTSINIAGLSDVARIGSGFLEGCTSLKTDFPALRAIEDK